MKKKGDENDDGDDGKNNPFDLAAQMIYFKVLTYMISLEKGIFMSFIPFCIKETLMYPLNLYVALRQTTQAGSVFERPFFEMLTTLDSNSKSPQA